MLRGSTENRSSKREQHIPNYSSITLPFNGLHRSQRKRSKNEEEGENSLEEMILEKKMKLKLKFEDEERILLKVIRR